MDDFADISPDSANQLDWLNEQIEMMETWLREKEANPATPREDIDKLHHHLNWLRENRVKAIEP